MKPNRESSQLSLPLLLSFNELAWIVIFAIGLICLACLAKVKDAQKGQDEITNLKKEITTNHLTISSLKLKLAEMEKPRLEDGEQLRVTKKLLAESQAKLENALANASNQATSYSNSVAKAEQDLKELARKLEDAQNERDGLQRRLDEALAKLRKVEADAKDLLAENQRLAALSRDLSNQVSSLNLRISELEQTTYVPVETSVRRELLDLSGKMENVAILLDQSGSMNDAGWMGNQSRWSNTVSVVQNWLNYVPGKRCVLIRFGDTAVRDPATGLYDMQGSKGVENRHKMIRNLPRVASGFTRTDEAFQAAYSYKGADKIDTIILFTDGAPCSDSTEHFDTKLATNVIQQVRDHTDVPINVVALGDYFKTKKNPDFKKQPDLNLVNFLLTIQHETGGEFIGKPRKK